jgi:hypothetical protein
VVRTTMMNQRVEALRVPVRREIPRAKPLFSIILAAT